MTSSSTPPPPPGLPCTGDNSCCSVENPCYEGEGDCDTDDECVPGLNCGRSNCQGTTFGDTDDCCQVDPAHLEAALALARTNVRIFWGGNGEVLTFDSVDSMNFL